MAERVVVVKEAVGTVEAVNAVVVAAKAHSRTTMAVAVAAMDAPSDPRPNPRHHRACVSVYAYQFASCAHALGLPFHSLTLLLLLHTQMYQLTGTVIGTATHSQPSPTMHRDPYPYLPTCTG